MATFFRMDSIGFFIAGAIAGGIVGGHVAGAAIGREKDEGLSKSKDEEKLKKEFENQIFLLDAMTLSKLKKQQLKAAMRLVLEMLYNLENAQIAFAQRQSSIYSLHFFHLFLNRLDDIKDNITIASKDFFQQIQDVQDDNRHKLDLLYDFIRKIMNVIVEKYSYIIKKMRRGNFISAAEQRELEEILARLEAEVQAMNQKGKGQHSSLGS